VAVAWPSTLQDKLNQASFSYALGETVLRSQMDIGPAKYRRRFTKGIDTLSCSILLKSTTEYNTFYNFYDSTLNGGVTRFEFVHPITGVLSEFRMSKAPSLRLIGGSVYEITMEWELAVT
jgi:hypothetical protein